MEQIWVRDRIRLYELRHEQPTWSQRRLAHEIGRSLSWVKKWLRRFRETTRITLATFQSQSRAPKTRPTEVLKRVREAILTLRDQLGERYWQRVGPKRILYHLHEDTGLAQRGYRLPTSPTTVWRVLREGGRIPQRSSVRPIALPRPAPLAEWEIDFGEIRLNREEKLEFLPVVDRGTSVLVDLVGSGGYNAETSLLTVAQLLIRHGCPQRIRMDNDTRFVWSWRSDRFPSAMVQFLNTLGIAVDVCDPGKPWQKPFVEHVVGTVKHEYLAKHQPRTLQTALALLPTYPPFYNAERPNQALVCNNQPPYRVFPLLPSLPHVPERVDADGWLRVHHDRVFTRQVGASGTVRIDKHSYYLNARFAGQSVLVRLDGHNKVFNFVIQNQLVKTLPVKGLLGGSMDFQTYLKTMLRLATSQERIRQQQARRQP